MVTIYVAAEKFIYWNELGELAVDESMVHELSSSNQIHRTVVYFAPERFGFWYDDMRDVEDAWEYLYSSLRMAGFCADETLLFSHETELDRFSASIDGSEGLVISGDSRDDELAVVLGGRRVSHLPETLTGFWHRFDIRRGFRALFAALSAS